MPFLSVVVHVMKLEIGQISQTVAMDLPIGVTHCPEFI